METTCTQWQSYEQVADYLLDRFAAEFGLGKVEEKQKVPGLVSGTTWEIDGKGVASDSDIFYVVECRRRPKSRRPQEELMGLAGRIHDTGATGGIMVSPLGLQQGAAMIATAYNIVTVRLDQESTRSDYILAFLKAIKVGRSGRITFSGTLSPKLIRSDGSEQDLGAL